MRFDVLRHIQLHLRKILSLSGPHLGIHLSHHVEYHIIIPRIAVMVVLIPVAGLVVNLDITHPQGFSDIDLRIKEVWSRIPIVQARIYHFDVLSVGCLQLPQGEQLVLPHIMK